MFLDWELPITTAVVSWHSAYAFITARCKVWDYSDLDDPLFCRRPNWSLRTCLGTTDSNQASAQYSTQMARSGLSACTRFHAILSRDWNNDIITWNHCVLIRLLQANKWLFHSVWCVGQVSPDEHFISWDCDFREVALHWANLKFVHACQECLVTMGLCLYPSRGHATAQITCCIWDRSARWTFLCYRTFPMGQRKWCGVFLT